MTQNEMPSIWILEINNVDSWSDEARLFTSREAAIDCFATNSRYHNVDDLDIDKAKQELENTGEFFFAGPTEDNDFDDEDYMEEDAESNAFKVTIRRADFNASHELSISAPAAAA